MVPWSRTLWNLPHSGWEHFSHFGQSLAGCLPLMHEKHILLSATTFARWVGVFSLNTAHFYSGCFPLHTIQGSKLVVVELPDGADFEPCEAPAKTFEEALGLIASSTRDFGKVVLFIRSWASALSLSQAAKWINVGWYMSCLTV